MCADGGDSTSSIAPASEAHPGVGSSVGRPANPSEMGRHYHLCFAVQDFCASILPLPTGAHRRLGPHRMASRHAARRSLTSCRRSTTAAPPTRSSSSPTMPRSRLAVSSCTDDRRSPAFCRSAKPRPTATPFTSSPTRSSARAATTAWSLRRRCCCTSANRTGATRSSGPWTPPRPSTATPTAGGPTHAPPSRSTRRQAMHRPRRRLRSASPHPSTAPAHPRGGGRGVYRAVRRSLPAPLTDEMESERSKVTKCPSCAAARASR